MANTKLTAVDSKRVEEYIRKREVAEVVSHVIEDIKTALKKYHQPSPVVSEGKIWVSTGKWMLLTFELDRFNLNLILALVWMDSDEFRDINPLGPERIGQPEHFGPGFELPRLLSHKFELTEIPTTQSGWATGVAPGVSEVSLPQLEAQLREELEKSGYLTKL